MKKKKQTPKRLSRSIAPIDVPKLKYHRAVKARVHSKSPSSDDSIINKYTSEYKPSHRSKVRILEQYPDRKKFRFVITTVKIKEQDVEKRNVVRRSNKEDRTYTTTKYIPKKGDKVSRVEVIERKHVWISRKQLESNHFTRLARKYTFKNIKAFQKKGEFQKFYASCQFVVADSRKLNPWTMGFTGAGAAATPVAMMVGVGVNEEPMRFGSKVNDWEQLIDDLNFLGTSGHDSDEEEPEVKKVKKVKKHRRCKAKTKHGKRCKNRAIGRSKFCQLHQRKGKKK